MLLLFSVHCIRIPSHPVRSGYLVFATALTLKISPKSYNVTLSQCSFKARCQGQLTHWKVVLRNKEDLGSVRYILINRIY
jgi:hypothetical protein